MLFYHVMILKYLESMLRRAPEHYLRTAQDRYCPNPYSLKWNVLLVELRTCLPGLSLSAASLPQARFLLSLSAVWDHASPRVHRMLLSAQLLLCRDIYWVESWCQLACRSSSFSPQPCYFAYYLNQSAYMKLLCWWAFCVIAWEISHLCAFTSSRDASSHFPGMLHVIKCKDYASQTGFSQEKWVLWQEWVTCSGLGFLCLLLRFLIRLCSFCGTLCLCFRSNIPLSLDYLFLLSFRALSRWWWWWYKLQCVAVKSDERVVVDEKSNVYLRFASWHNLQESTNNAQRCYQVCWLLTWSTISSMTSLCSLRDFSGRDISSSNSALNCFIVKVLQQEATLSHASWCHLRNFDSTETMCTHANGPTLNCLGCGFCASWWPFWAVRGSQTPFHRFNGRSANQAMRSQCWKGDIEIVSSMH